MNREPFWWPMNEPPLPTSDENLHNGWPPYEPYRRPGRNWNAQEDLQVDPSVTAIAANQARMAQIFHRIAKEDAELLERLADG